MDSVAGSTLEKKAYGIAYHYRVPWEGERKEYEGNSEKFLP